MKEKHTNCGWVDAGYPINTAGDRMIWHCECDSTGCLKPINHFEEMYRENELSKSEEEKFYKKVFKPKMLFVGE